MGIPTPSPWLPIHTGLLDDERWSELSPAARGAWIVLYLLLDREPDRGWFRDRGRVDWLCRRHGIKPATIEELIQTGWLVPLDDSPQLTIRKWETYTDAKARKAVHNAGRDRSGDGLSPRETAQLPRRREETKKRRDESTSPRASAHEGGAMVSSVLDGRSFKEIVGWKPDDPEKPTS